MRIGLRGTTVQIGEYMELSLFHLYDTVLFTFFVYGSTDQAARPIVGRANKNTFNYGQAMKTIQ